MFSRTNTAEQAGVEFRIGVVAPGSRPDMSFVRSNFQFNQNIPDYPFQPVIARLPTHGSLPGPAYKSSIAIRPATWLRTGSQPKRTAGEHAACQ